MEQYFNDYGTTLTAGITAAQTTLNVMSTYGYPSTGNFRIRIDSELMLVTGISGDTWTVVRGIESTAAASHLSGATIGHFLTGGGLAQILTENGASGTGALITWKGTWGIGTGYNLNDAVSYNGSSYISLQNGNIAQQPDTSSAWWALIAAGETLNIQTNGTNNTTQSLLNLKSGANITITDDGSGGVTIASASSASMGTLATRPSASVSGRLYFATDQSFMYFDNGSSWYSFGNLTLIPTAPDPSSFSGLNAETSSVAATNKCSGVQLSRCE
jgi:hypothetical protein